MEREFTKWCKDNGLEFKHRKNNEAALSVYRIMKQEIDQLKDEYRADLLDIKREIKRL